MKTLFKVCIAFLLLLCGLIGCLAQSTSPSGYHLLKEIHVGGEGGWDYLYADSSNHRLYISHSTKVVVVDTETDAVVGEILNTSGVHGIAIADDLGRGFISDGRDDSVTIFDPATLKTLGTVKTGKNPDAIIYDLATKRVFAFNGGSGDTTVIDAATGTVAATITLGGKPEFATSDGKGKVFVNIEDKSDVVEIDSKKLSVITRWPIAPGEEASGMAIDRKNRRLFIVCSNKKMIVLNADTGKVTTDLAIGNGPDAAAYDPDSKFAFSSNGEGTLTVVKQDSADKFSVLDTVTTRRGARTMTIDTKTHKLYLPTAEYGPAPAPTAERPRPRPTIVPNSFTILVYGR